MADKKNKYLNIGSVVRYEDNESIQLDNGPLIELVNYLKAHGKQYLEGLSLEEIRERQKLKKDDARYIPRIRFYFFEPHEKAPNFIKKNVSIKLK